MGLGNVAKMPMPNLAIVVINIGIWVRGQDSPRL